MRLNCEPNLGNPKAVCSTTQSISGNYDRTRRGPLCDLAGRGRCGLCTPGRRAGRAATSLRRCVATWAEQTNSPKRRPTCRGAPTPRATLRQAFAIYAHTVQYQRQRRGAYTQGHRGNDAANTAAAAATTTTPNTANNTQNKPRSPPPEHTKNPSSATTTRPPPNSPPHICNAHAHSEAAGNKTQNPSQPSTPSPCEKVCRRLWQPLQRTTAGLVQSAATMPKYHLRKRISGGERANANKSGEDKQERAGRRERPSQLKYARQRLACATLGSSRNM